MQVSASGILLKLLCMGMALGTVLSYNVGAADEPAIDSVALSSARDFIYAPQPQRPTEDTVLVTAQLYAGGKPLKKAGIPVDFGLGDGRFATLDDGRVYTDEWGAASTRVRSYSSGQPLPDRPFLLAVRASAGGKTAQVTLPMTGYMPLGGRVEDRKGDPVEGATVSLLYDRTRVPIKAGGSTTTTNVYGEYRLDRVPTDLGGVVVYVKKGDMEASMPADFSGTALRMR